MADVAALEAKLSEYDFVVCIDASGSMAEPNDDRQPNGVSRWARIQEDAIAFCRDLDKIDSDGIDVVFFGGGQATSHRNVNADKVKQVFAERSPRGGTPLAEALTEALKLGGSKKKFILVWTDGTPDNPESVIQVIRNQANKQQTDEECTFLFVQVGRDAQASAYLRKLDDNLNAKFDIVDAMTIEEAEKFPSTAEMVIKAISD